VLEVVFIFSEPLSSSRRIFIDSHSLPSLWFAVSVIQLSPKLDLEVILESSLELVGLQVLINFSL
jgi:hypothetical protein